MNIVKSDAHYSVAILLPLKFTDDEWNKFLQCWVSIYVEFPEILKEDHGSVITSAKCNKYASDYGIEIEINKVESSNFINQRDHVGSDRDLFLTLYNKSMKYTCGPEVLVYSILIYGVLIRLGTDKMGMTDQDTRMNLMQNDRLEME